MTTPTDEAPSAPTDSAAAATAKPKGVAPRPRWAPWALLVFVVVGFFLFRGVIPQDTRVTLAVPPTVLVGAERVSRSEVVQIRARVYDEGEQVAQTELATPGGLTTPVAPSFSLTIPTGTYLVSVEARLRDGRVATLGGSLVVEDDVDATSVPLK